MCHIVHQINLVKEFSITLCIIYLWCEPNMTLHIGRTPLIVTCSLAGFTQWPLLDTHSHSPQLLGFFYIWEKIILYRTRVWNMFNNMDHNNFHILMFLFINKFEMLFLKPVRLFPNPPLWAHRDPIFALATQTYETWMARPVSVIQKPTDLPWCTFTYFPVTQDKFRRRKTYCSSLIDS